MNLFYAFLCCFASCLCGSKASIWPSSCCFKKTSVKNLKLKNIVDCKVQRAGLCPFDSIIIKTRKGRELCYDPQEEWVVKNIVMNGANACDVSLPQKKPRKNKKPGRGRKRGKRKGKQEKGV